MNLHQLPQALAAHKVPLLAGGAGVAVIAGLRTRKAGAKPAGGVTGQVVPIGSPAGSSADSTANDLYNAIQPQLEALQRQLDAAGGSGNYDAQIAALADKIATLGDQAPTQQNANSNLVSVPIASSGNWFMQSTGVPNRTGVNQPVRLGPIGGMIVGLTGMATPAGGGASAPRPPARFGGGGVSVFR